MAMAAEERASINAASARSMAPRTPTFLNSARGDFPFISIFPAVTAALLEQMHGE
jgi:hypothetical protein